MAIGKVSKYQDPVLVLAYNPDLNRLECVQKEAERLIEGFEVSDRHISNLCRQALRILNKLESIQMNSKNWLFISLDVNSGRHFDETSDSEMKLFNTKLSLTVISNCMEFQRSLSSLSNDLDRITGSLKILSGNEFISDGGSFLVSVVLRCVKLKEQLFEDIFLSYSKARLIIIGSEIENITEGCDREAIKTYRLFVSNILNQLQRAIDTEDNEQKHECMAIIKDVEDMYQSFCIQQLSKTKFNSVGHLKKPHSELYLNDHDRSYNISIKNTESISSTVPVAHASTYIKPRDLAEKIANRKTGVIEDLDSDSVPFVNTLGKTTIEKNIPYLMSAFSSAKNFEEDLSHFQSNQDFSKHNIYSASKGGGKYSNSNNHQVEEYMRSPEKYHIHYENHFLPDKDLYSEGSFLKDVPKLDTRGLLFSNQSLISKFGIRPQIIDKALLEESQKHMEPTSNITETKKICSSNGSSTVSSG